MLILWVLDLPTPTDQPGNKWLVLYFVIHKSNLWVHHGGNSEYRPQTGPSGRPKYCIKHKTGKNKQRKIHHWIKIYEMNSDNDKWCCSVWIFYTTTTVSMHFSHGTHFWHNQNTMKNPKGKAQMYLKSFDDRSAPSPNSNETACTIHLANLNAMLSS